MHRCDLDTHFSKINSLVAEINRLVPEHSYDAVQFRADLAGLLVVSMAATYEACVKDILYGRACRYHPAFGEFTSRQFSRLNSKIRIYDLEKYCGLYDPSLKRKFKTELARKKELIIQKTGKDITKSYEQILDWRHDFAHASIRNSTIEETARTHTFGKRVLYVFASVFLYADSPALQSV